MPYHLLQLEARVEEFAAVEKIYAHPIDWDALGGGVWQPREFIDRWWILLWDKAFLPFFSSEDSKFVKGFDLKTFKGGPKAIKRVVSRAQHSH